MLPAELNGGATSYSGAPSRAFPPEGHDLPSVGAG